MSEHSYKCTNCTQGFTLNELVRVPGPASQVPNVLLCRSCWQTGNEGFWSHLEDLKTLRALRWQAMELRGTLGAVEARIAQLSARLTVPDEDESTEDIPF